NFLKNNKISYPVSFSRSNLVVRPWPPSSNAALPGYSLKLELANDLCCWLRNSQRPCNFDIDLCQSRH
ncbi:hypothetical protein TorRG33x02_096150, partial [Trema orientale]